MKLNYWYPVLDSTAYTIGIMIDEKGKTQIFKCAEMHFKAIQEYTKRAKKRNEKNYIYGHNHRYDFYGYAKGHFFDNNLKTIVENPLYAILDEKTYFHDTISFFPESLKKIGKNLKIDKKEMPLIVKDLNELIPYCKRDVEITLKAIIDLKKNLKKIGYPCRKLQTAGQTAMTTFLSSIRKKNIHWSIMRNGEVFKSPNIHFLRLAYRGGRCVAYKKGKFKKVVCIDKNAAFSEAMVKMKFPDLQSYLHLNKPKLKDWELIKKTIGVIQCTIQINVKKEDIPYLPVFYRKKAKAKNETIYQKKKNGINLYPYKSKVTGTWTINEIKRAEELKQIKLLKIYEAEVYKTNKINPLSEYIKNLYDLGIKEKRFKKVSKILRNNLYGKFAQISERKETKLIYRADLDEWLFNGWEIIGYMDDKCLMELKKESYIPKYSNPLITALITAWVRNEMYDQIIKVPRKDLLYWSEDSIMMTNFEKYKHLFDLTPKKLGAFKIEKKGDCEIRGRKNYKIGKTNIIAGVPKRDFKKNDYERGYSLIRRQIGIKQALMLHSGKLIGKFENTKFDLMGSNLDDFEIPTIIDEREFY